MRSTFLHGRRRLCDVACDTRKLVATKVDWLRGIQTLPPCGILSAPSPFVSDVEETILRRGLAPSLGLGSAHFSE
jgi:hypothetical protein